MPNAQRKELSQSFAPANDSIEETALNKKAINAAFGGSSGAVDLDDSGKVVMDHIYDEVDPRAYFRALRMLQYRIPEAVQPVLQNLIAARRRAGGQKNLKLIDLGCSYGVTGRLFRSGQTMDETFHHYAGSANKDRDDLVKSDRKIFETYGDQQVSIIGLDVATKACEYAVDCGAIDAAVVANLEEDDPTPEQAAHLRDADLLVSTGCIGYVGAPTMTRILDACGDSRPWMAHFVMRMFDFTPIRNVLTARGYVTTRGRKPVYQRNFASPAEQDEIVTRLVELGRDPTGREDDGAAYADLFISRPADERDQITPKEWSEVLQTS